MSALSFPVSLARALSALLISSKDGLPASSVFSRVFLSLVHRVFWGFFLAALHGWWGLSSPTRVHGSESPCPKHWATRALPVHWVLLWSLLPLLDL